MEWDEEPSDATLDKFELDEEKRLELEGARLTRLVVGWDWIDRRIESVTCLDDVEARREVSVAFTLPPDLPPAAVLRPKPSAMTNAGDGHSPGISHFYYVPLTLIGKEDLTRFDFTDDSGELLPLLTSREKGLMAGGLLARLARYALAEKALPETIENELRLIATEPSTEAVARWKTFKDQWSDDAYQTLHDGPSHEARLFRALLTTLTLNHLVIVPLQTELGIKRIVKFSYIERMNERPEARSAGFPKDVLRSFGWRPKQFWIPTPAIGQGGSYHFELTAPPGLKVTTTRLIPMEKINNDWKRISVPPNQRRLRSERQPHVFVRGVPVGSVGMVHAKVRARGAAVVRAAWFLALGVAAILIIGHEYLSQLLQGNLGATDSAVTVLLVGPTAVSVYITRSSEHEMTTSVLYGIRLLTLGSGITSFTAACLIALAEDTPTTHAAWLVCMCTAIAIAVALSYTAFETWRADDSLINRLRQRG